MLNHHQKLTLSVLLLSLVSSTVFAAEGEHAGGGSHEEGHAKNHLGIFLGSTKEEGHYRDTYGIEYARRINDLWSIGGVIERAERDEDSTLAIVVVHYRVSEALHLGLGFGRKDPSDESRAVGRFSIGYDIKLGGGWFLSPEVAMDFIKGEEDEQVFGLIVSKSF